MTKSKLLSRLLSGAVVAALLPSCGLAPQSDASFPKAGSQPATKLAANQPSKPATPGAPSNPDTSCIDGNAFSCTAEAAIVKYTNDIRARNGKSALTQDFRLSYVARDWSRQQGIFINHFGFPWARANVFSQRFPGVQVPDLQGENVAMNWPEQSAADAIAKAFADQWENSPGHLANILRDQATIGVGLVCSGASLTPSDDAKDSTLTMGSCTGTQIFAK